MNMGDGVPCTINSIGYKGIEPVPERTSVMKRIRDDFNAEVTDRVTELEDKLKDLRKTLAETKLSKVQQDKLLDSFREYGRMFSSHAPFLLDQFEEAVEKTVVGAKSEMDAFVTHAIMKTGLEALKNQAPVLHMTEPPVKVVE
jgi:hypothetical protein